MTSTDSNIAAVPVTSRWRLYLQLTKPKVVALIILTAVVGTLLATPGWPPLDALIFGNLGIGLARLRGDAEPAAGPAHRRAHDAHPLAAAAHRRH